MFVNFEELPSQARLWVYQSHRSLSPQEAEIVMQKVQAFIEGWVAHQKPLKASAQLLHQRFLLIAVDESYNLASGCSIDASVHFLKELEQALDLNLFDRSQVAYLQGEAVQTEAVKNLKKKVAEGQIQSDTIIFNNTVATLADWQQKWKQPAGESWLARYF